MPPVPSLTCTRFGTVCPATKFRFETFGRLAPVGYTVTKLEVVGLVMVTLSTTADTPVIGTPLAPPVPAT